MPYIVKISPISHSPRPTPNGRRPVPTPAEVRDFDRYLATRPRIRAPIARKNLGHAPDIPIGSDVIVWRNDMRRPDTGGVMAFGRTASGPERATADLLVEGIGAVVETGDWYSDIDLIERFDEPPVSMDDMVREFSESGYVQDFLPRRASVHYLIDDGMFQRIHHLAMLQRTNS